MTSNTTLTSPPKQYWFNHKILQKNREPGRDDDLNILKASTLIQDLPHGLIIYKKWGQINFRYIHQRSNDRYYGQRHPASACISIAGFKQTNNAPHINFEHGWVASLEHFRWYTAEIARLLPTAMRLLTSP